MEPDFELVELDLGKGNSAQVFSQSSPLKSKCPSDYSPKGRKITHSFEEGRGIWLEGTIGEVIPEYLIMPDMETIGGLMLTPDSGSYKEFSAVEAAMKEGKSISMGVLLSKPDGIDVYLDRNSESRLPFRKKSSQPKVRIPWGVELGYVEANPDGCLTSTHRRYHAHWTDFSIDQKTQKLVLGREILTEGKYAPAAKLYEISLGLGIPHLVEQDTKRIYRGTLVANTQQVIPNKAKICLEKIYFSEFPNRISEHLGLKN
ncbi:MAG: hypothetical protein JW727_03070 [Candidatus Aenigmarchaeota archaeon]|nr:hypothetical protein [Candidatus Aenigmarchaeota archaeon]